MNAQSISDQAEAAILGTVSTQILRGDRQVPVRVRYPANLRNNADVLAAIPVLTPSGALVPLNSLGAFEYHPGSFESAREDQRRLVSVSAHLEGIDLGTGVAKVRKVLAGVTLPPGVTVVLGGQYQTQTQTFQNLLEVLVLAILLVYAVMVFQFGSFTSPTVIMLVMPLALFGAVTGLYLREPR